MLATDPKVRCPSCGTKNPADSERCRICTRSLSRDQTPSQAAFEDALYARPVRQSASPAPWVSKSTLAILLVLGLIGLNYFFIGAGPSWAHRDMVTRGETWRTFVADQWTAILPGRPDQDRVHGPNGELRRYRVGVDENWVSTIDADTLAPAARAKAIDELYATVVVANGVAVDDLVGQAAALVAATMPGAELTEADVRPIENAKFGQQVELTAEFRGGTREFGRGTVEARLVSDGANTFVLAGFVEHGADPALLQLLASGFSPDSAHAAPAAGN